MPANAKRQLLAIAALVILTLAAYAGALRNDFVWDDRGYILDTPELRDAGNIGLIADPELYFTRFQEGSWRPVVTSSHFLTVSLFGYWAPGHNGFDLLLYAIVVVLVFATALKLGMGEKAAFLASMIFAVHPVHVEPVLVSALRADTLCAAFLLLSFLCLLNSYEGVRSQAWLAGALGLFALGLLSKEVALVFPFMVAAYDGARFLKERSWRPTARALALRYGALLAVMGAYLFLRFGPFAGPPHSAGYIGGSPLKAALTMLAIIAQYTRLLFFPLSLNADYLVRPVASLMELRALLGFGALVVLLSATVQGYRRWPLFGFSLAVLLLTLLPVSNMVPLDNPMAERYLFIPSIGFCWALGLIGAKALESIQRKGQPAAASGLWAAIGLIIVTLGVRTAYRAADWKDELTLWRATVAASPESSRAHLNLGSAMLLKGRWVEGRKEVEKALALDSTSHEAFHNLGLIEAQEGNWAEAERYYRRSNALQADAPPTLYNLARALAAQGKDAEALGYLEDAIARKPLFSEAYVLKGNLLMAQGRIEEAEGAFKRATEADPEGAIQAYTNLGNAERALGRLEAAEEAYRKAIELEPRSAEAHFNLASLYGQQGRFQETIVELERTVAADPGMVVAHKNLGLLYLKVLRDPSRARQHLNRVLELAPDHPEAPAIRRLLQIIPPS